MQLVILAAGHGRRFGGLKQLAPVGPNGEAIMDYTARAARACRFDSVVVVVRDDIRDEVEAHIDKHWSDELPVHLVCQQPPPGTVQAVLAARPFIDGPFAVANADDLYDELALAAIGEHFAMRNARRDDRHVLVGFELAKTVLGTEPLTRGILDVTPEGELRGIIEHTVQARDDGSFDAWPLGTERPQQPTRLLDQTYVSMNLWGFHPRMLDALSASLGDARDETHERILPDAIAHLLASGQEHVRVVTTSARCIGITHQQDAAVVRNELAFRESATFPTSNRT